MITNRTYLRKTHPTRILVKCFGAASKTGMPFLAGSQHCFSVTKFFSNRTFPKDTEKINFFFLAGEGFKKIFFYPVVMKIHYRISKIET